METYVIVLLLLVTAYLVKTALFPSVNVPGKKQAKTKKPKKKAIVEGTFTPRELSKYNGHDEQEIFIAVKGNVYDVTSGRSFYGPLGPYSNFAGHDASRGLAKNSFDFDVIRDFDEPIDTLEDLTEDEIKALDGWESTFKRKYPIIGKLVPE